MKCRRPNLRIGAVEPVIYPAGNHEFHGQSWQRTRVDLRSACKGSNIAFLESDVFEFGGVRFLGATLWTDLPLKGFLQSGCLQAVEGSFNDYSIIRTQKGPLRAQDALDNHEQSRRWLERELAKPYPGQTVVVTHHGPHPLSIHPRYAGDPVNAGFVSDLTELMPGVRTWLHGHVHDSFDYVVECCPVVANPAGHTKNHNRFGNVWDAPFESRFFNPECALEISTKGGADHG